ncbi:MATE family efflux transporter [uncultured Tateyamaria sp.]|uniref:MATE family efflux transporter n=1 Tax=uncultured Tateyamaria sp. TaxID=455651 RepID=UPI00260707A9|nr:MATE family efflux transporter [uncultured Tateyamaria sp.]
MKQFKSDVARSEVRGFYRTSLHVALFALISYAVDYSFQLVDIYWATQIGVGAPTAIAVVSSIFFLTLSLNEVIGVGTVAVFAQRFGQTDHARTGEAILLALLVKAVLGIMSAGVFLLLIDFVLISYELSETELLYTQDYTKVIWLSLLLVPVYSTMMTAMRTVGRAHLASYISVAAFVINVVANPILIFGYGPIPPLGIAGAAWATVLAQLIAMLCCFFMMQDHRFPVPVFSRGLLSWQPQLAWSFLVIGLPVGGVILLYNFEQVILTALLTEYGAEVSDGYGVGARIFGLFFMVNFGIGLGIAVAVGHAIGSGRIELIRHCIPRISLMIIALLTAVALLIFLFADYLMLAFNDNSVTVQIGAIYLRFMAFANIAIGIIYCYNGVFEGAGRNSPPLAIAVVIYLAFEFPALAYLGWFTAADLSWVWLTVSATYVLGAALTVRQFCKTTWRLSPAAQS